MPQAERKNVAGIFKRAVGGARPFVLLCSLLLFCSFQAGAQTVRLESGWQFLADKEGAHVAGEVGSAQGWRDVRVGLSWNAQFADMRDYMGAAWYRTRFDVADLKGGRRALLTFGAVDYFCEVFVNGRKVGEHEGGYTPFSFDVTKDVKAGANDILVRVVDPPMDERENRALYPRMMYNEIPHGKQNWYVQTGGIWQPVWIDVKPQVHIKSAKVITQNDGRLSIAIDATGPVPVAPNADNNQPGVTPLDFEVKIFDPSGKRVDSRMWGGGKGALQIHGRIANPQLWDTEHPNLYTFEIRYGEDVYKDSFGFRSFEARDGKFYLNGEPFYMIAALDQDFYPETIYSVPSEAYVRDAMRKAKRLGLNLLRCHIKVCDPVYLKVADEEGMLVWYEIPSWNDFNHFTPQAAARGERILAEMTARDWNHPSIVIQSVINESWGADLKKPEQRRWLLEAYERAKKFTAARGTLVVDNSACCNNFHLKTDLNDFHQYYSQPDNHERWDKWVADFAARPKWTFSPHGDAQPTGREPLVVSEFGNWGLPKLPKDLPWWFARDFGGREVTRPLGVRERFKEFHLDSLFRDYDELAVATEWHQFRSLKHEIEEIRRYGTIQGYVITEFTDINWEANGLMDMWRNPKAYAEELSKIQRPDVVLARLPKRNFTGGESVEIPVLLSHYGNRDIGTMSVKWSTSTGQEGRVITSLAMGRARVQPRGTISLTLPAVAGPQRVKLSLRAIHVSGRPIAENSYDLFVYPQPAAGKRVALFFHGTPKGEGEAGKWNALKAALASAGYRVVNETKSINDASLLVSTSFDSQVERHLRDGGRAIILANSKDALPQGAAFKVVPREGDLDGNWVTNFNWVRVNREPFSAVPFGPILGFEGVKTVPRFIIQNVPGAAYTDVLAGIFYGWINDNAAFCVQVKVGRGKALLTTFRFDEYGRDPYATRLLDAMLTYVSGAGFAPALDWDGTATK